MRNILLVFLLFTIRAAAQNVGIGTTTPHASAQLEVNSHSKGILIPRNTFAGVDSIVNPAKGLIVMDTAGNQLMINAGTETAPDWKVLSPEKNNKGTETGTAARLVDDAASCNTALGSNALLSVTSGAANTAMGCNAMVNENTGYSNVALGASALYAGTSNRNIVAVGDSALFYNRSVINDTLSGTGNTAVGSKSLLSNTTGFGNTSMGFNSLYSNNTGLFNTAMGYQALYKNTIGQSNTALGGLSLGLNSSGAGNVGVGYGSLGSNSTGAYNTAVGFDAFTDNQKGSYNTSIGYRAGQPFFGLVNNATALGAKAQVGCSNCIILGSIAGINSALFSVNVGIGTNNPVSTFEVWRNTNAASTAYFRGSGNDYGSVFNSGTDEDTYIRGGKLTSKVIINDFIGSGNIGLGISAPTNKVHIGNGTVRMEGQANASGTSLSIGQYGDVAVDATGIAGGRFIIKNNGLTGISTINPNSTLEVWRNPAAISTAHFRGSIDGSYFNYSTTEDTYIRGGKPGAKVIINDFAGAGNIGLGTSFPTNKVHVGNGTVRIEGQAASGGTSLSIGGFGDVAVDASGIVGGRFMIKDNGNTGVGTNAPSVKFQVGNAFDGTVARANSWSLFSDKRWKKDITPIINALDKVQHLNGYYYYWINGEDKKQQVGVMAQEVELVLPEVVATDTDGYKSVDYGKMNAMLIMAIKEQQALIEAQQKKLEAIEKKLAAVSGDVLAK